MRIYFNTNTGYAQVYVNGKVVGYHRYIMEEHLGRKLSPEEVVHHINGDKLDNRIENLEVVLVSEHSRNHRLLEGKVLDMICPFCGSIFKKKKWYVDDKLRKGRKNIFCSKECSNNFMKKCCQT